MLVIFTYSSTVCRFSVLFSLTFSQFEIDSSSFDTLILQNNNVSKEQLRRSHRSTVHERYEYDKQAIFCLQVLSNDGRIEVGKIKKHWGGLCREIFSDADTFGVSFPLDLDVRQKALTLGACFLIVSIAATYRQKRGRYFRYCASKYSKTDLDALEMYRVHIFPSYFQIQEMYMQTREFWMRVGLVEHSYRGGTLIWIDRPRTTTLLSREKVVEVENPE